MGLRVLVIEDDALVAMLIGEMLDELGHSVAGAAHRFDEALQLAGETDADAAILDVNLGGHSTYAVAHALTERGVPLVFATGYGAAGVDPEWRHAPVLEKPFETDALDAVLKRAALS